MVRYVLFIKKVLVTLNLHSTQKTKYKNAVRISISIWCSSTFLISYKYTEQRTWLRALTIFASLTCPAVTMLFLDLITLLIVSHSSTETPHQHHSAGKTAIWVNIVKNNGPPATVAWILRNDSKYMTNK